MQNQQNPQQNNLNSQPVQGNVVKPQQQAMQQNAQQPVQQQPLRQPQKQKGNATMSSYEKRFREFLKNKFGGMIGNTLLDNEMKKLKITNISALSDAEQMSTMENILHSIFQEHHMQKSEENTRLEMKLELCLDKAAENMQSYAKEVKMEPLNVNHNNATKTRTFITNEDSTETYWCTLGTTTGILQAKLYLFTTERQSMMLMTEYAKSQKMEFNPLDEELKNKVFYSFLNFIGTSYLSVSKTLLGIDIQFQFTETKPVDINFIEGIDKEIAETEKKQNAKVDMTSVDTKITFDRQEFAISLFVAH